jgi:EAL domain-containing protein (putative c-di-GMP-specific phosphodiesterase class I)
MFEFTENEPIRDTQHIKRIAEAYRQFSFITALDDFGAGYAGLGWLARIQPNPIKVDMEVLRGIDARAPKRAILKGLLIVKSELGIKALAQGVETEAEFRAMWDLFQGYLFGRPSLGRIDSSHLRAA